MISNGAIMVPPILNLRMPSTKEIVCTDESCELDMFELHFTYDMPDDVVVADFSCPYCGGVSCLEELVVK